MTRPLVDVAAQLDLTPDALLPYGRDRAKLPLSLASRPARGRLVLVTALTPTPAGEGKTTTSIGLAQGLSRIGERPCLALREPSLGPCFGIKGGGTGGGRSRVEPSTTINLHFNGDIHAIGAAHNLAAAVLDNHLHFRGGEIDIDPRRVWWPRVVDMNDRALRQIVVGLAGHGAPREASFAITAASEVMAILCLAQSEDDLRARLARTTVALGRDRNAIRIGDLGIEGAMLALLQEALMPNLVQTTEGTPAILHGGPFANIAHGCNSVLATRTALGLSDWCITEAGFGADLGAEKFFHIKCRQADLKPALTVMVATVRALRWHGGVTKKTLADPNPEAVRQGLANLDKHLANVAAFGQRVVVAINHRADDTDEEIQIILDHCAANGVPCAVSRHFAEGGAGAEDLARLVVEHAAPEPTAPRYLYDLQDSVPDKLRALARIVYGADGVELGPKARKQLKLLQKLGADTLPVCVAKTSASISDDPALRGAPSGFTLQVREFAPSTGAGFVVALTGDIMRMPGLPRRPQALGVDLVDGVIQGVQ